MGVEAMACGYGESDVAIGSGYLQRELLRVSFQKISRADVPQPLSEGGV